MLTGPPPKFHGTRDNLGRDRLLQLLRGRSLYPVSSDANDLIELTNLQVPLAKVGVGSGAPDCGSDPMMPKEAADDDFSQGALGETVCSLRNSNPQLANLRAYIPELVGWFDDFSTSGTIDASGPLGRIEGTFNTFSLSDNGLPDLLLPVDPADVLGLVREAGGELLASARVFDVYAGEQVGEGNRSLAIRLEFRAPDRTLTDEEVAARRDAIESALASIGGRLRG